MTIDEIYLSEALKEARAGGRRREEPVGAVVVAGRRIVGRAHHQTRALRDPTAHAAMIALTQAAAALEQNQKGRAELFVTEAPCRMCLAAAQLVGIKRIVYGTVRRGVRWRKIRMVGGILEKECAAVLRAGA